ncbi:MAG: HlyD family efflux transporter periplasmic adaptor subunit [Dactylosporangium sp.]|nr:efflux RND transporter periplasmic adaptor subunit [Dactylosporangium sp.]NNJ63680.1 HlyD family efflux transporter periplasmic adaptor subunit [Dactylosporangium sp.]
MGMRLLRRPTIVLNAALAALALAGIGWAYHAVTASDTDAAASTTGERVVTAASGDVTATVSASGTVESATTADASFVTSGTVTEIHVKVGDVVTEGQLVAKVDPTDAQNDLATARANLTAAEQSLARAEANDSDDATIASAEAKVTQAQTTVDTAQRAVDGTALTAPIAGTVTAVNGAVGSASGGGSSSGGSSSGGDSSSGGSSSGSSSGFVQLADLSTLQVAASFAETDATKLTVGQAATVTWSALSGTTATATVASIAPTATTSNNVNTYAVVATLDTSPDGARLGQSTTVEVTVAEATDVLRIPTAALVTAGSRYSVRVRTAETTETRTVEIGVQGDQYVEITSGLTAGERVLITVTVTSSDSSRDGGNQQGGLPGGNTGGGPAGGGPGGGR